MQQVRRAQSHHGGGRTEPRQLYLQGLRPQANELVMRNKEGSADLSGDWGMERPARSCNAYSSAAFRAFSEIFDILRAADLRK
jgi:hypothetical protein